MRFSRMTTVALALLAMVMISTWAMAQAQEKMDGDKPAAKEDVDKGGKDMMGHRQNVMAEHKARLDTIAKALDDAEKAVKDGKDDDAIAAIGQARTALKEAQEKLAKCPMCKPGEMCEKCKAMSKCPECRAKGEMCDKCKAMSKCPDCKAKGEMCDKCKAKMEAKGDNPGETKKVDNAKCPIMGTKLDKDNVPVDLTREFKGQTVGFCCPNCPPAWDKLSDDEKQAKLDAAK